METTGAVHGFDRNAVEEYLRAVADERARLQAELEEARSRIERAHAALSSRRLIAAMVLDACDDVHRARRTFHDASVGTGDGTDPVDTFGSTHEPVRWTAVAS